MFGTGINYIKALIYVFWAKICCSADFPCNNYYWSISTFDTCSPFDPFTCSSSSHWSERSLDSGSSLTDLSHLTLDLSYRLKACPNLGIQFVLTGFHYFIDLKKIIITKTMDTFHTSVCIIFIFFLNIYKTTNSKSKCITLLCIKILWGSSVHVRLYAWKQFLSGHWSLTLMLGCHYELKGAVCGSDLHVKCS